MKVTAVTSSKLSIIVDLGAIEGIRAGDRAIFFSNDTIGKRNIMQVASGEAIKVYPDHSFWHLNSIREKRELKVGNTLGMIAESEVRKGVRELSKRRQKVILPANHNAKEYLEDKNRDYPQKRMRGQDDYISSYDKVVSTEAPSSYDYEQPQFYEWVEGEVAKVDGFEETVTFMFQKKYPRLRTLEDIEAKISNEIFKSYVESATNKSREDISDIVAIEKNGLKSSNSNSVFRNYTDVRRREQKITSDSIRKIERKGPMWSTGMDDEELRRYLIDTGLQSEIKRRETVLENRLDHEFQFTFSMGAISNATGEGEKEKLLPKHLQVGYETYMGRVTDALENVTIGLSFESGTGYYESVGLNLRSEELSFATSINYFLYDAPTTLKKFIPFVGLGFKVGRAEVSNSYLNNDYLYQILAVPTATFGFKYRFHAGDEFNDYFHAGVGTFAGITYERIQLTTAEVLRDEDIEETITKNSIKFKIGVSFYF